MQRLYILVGSLAFLLILAGYSGVLARPNLGITITPQATVSSKISYQGQLTAPDGAPLDGDYTMRFIIYDADAGGSALWDSNAMEVTVTDGLLNVILDVDQAIFNGQALWLSITVDGETLSPRQEILPAPYALSLRPGAVVVGDEFTHPQPAFAAVGAATGTALYANATGGVAFNGSSATNYGVWGGSNESWGGYFTSNEGYAIRAHTNGTDHYDHGAYITATGGYAVYAQSESNQGVRGEAGDVSGAAQPLGAVGVVGIGANRGAYGSSVTGIGVYGASTSNYGVWGQSTSGRGVTGRTGNDDNNYGLYTPDNLYSLNVSLAGSITQVMQNGGGEPLRAGDVVVFSGIARDVEGVDSPLAQVSRADTAASAAVAGVVLSRFNLDALDPDLDGFEAGARDDGADLEVTSLDAAQPGEFVLVVVQGLAQVNVQNPAELNIEPGDLLSTSATQGYATRAAQMRVNGIETPILGTVLGKALEPLTRAEGQIYVYVTLQ
ncbi:MAG: hypothetical protein WDZ49_13650 [Litorilinea sp.]